MGAGGEPHLATSRTRAALVNIRMDVNSVICIGVVRRAGKCKVSRLFALNSQDRDLARRESNVLGGAEIERARESRLVPNGCNNKALHRNSDG